MTHPTPDPLREAVQKIVDGDYDRPVAHIWRGDGLQSKHDTCPHSEPMWEDFLACMEQALRALLAERDALIHDIERAKASETALLAERDAARAEGYRQGQENMRSRIASPLFLRPLVDEQSAGEWYEETLAADTQMYADAILAVPLAPEGS